MILRSIALLASCLYTSAFPNTPMFTCGSEIWDSNVDQVTFAGVNWPGASEGMIPEGLQYSSIKDIVSKVKSLGMNIIRLTYATEMIDDIFLNAPTNLLDAALVQAVGDDAAPGILASILKHNPQFTAKTKRLEVYDAVAQECLDQGIYIHLDNHQNKAQFCCPDWDGNTWFGDYNFDVDRWIRGLGFMADHAKNWPALVSMSLKNEFRRPKHDDAGIEGYNWPSWLENVVPAANAIHGNNSLPLIYFSGMDLDVDMSFPITGQIEGNEFVWKPGDYDFNGKIVYEIHKYTYDDKPETCPEMEDHLYKAAYGAMAMSDDDYPNKGPVVMSEFGFAMDGGYSESLYAQCLKDYLLKQPYSPGSWMQWVLAGSYYIRTDQGLDSDETYGLLNHDWSGWRNDTVIDQYVKPFVKATLGL